MVIVVSVKIKSWNRAAICKHIACTYCATPGAPHLRAAMERHSLDLDKMVYLNWRPGQNDQIDTYFPEKAVEIFKMKQKQTC